MHLRELGLTNRSCEALSGAGIKKVEHLIRMSPAQLRAIKGLGVSSLTDILGELMALMSGELIAAINDYDRLARMQAEYDGLKKKAALFDRITPIALEAVEIRQD